MLIRLVILTLFLLPLARADNDVLEAWLKRQSSITSLDAPFTQQRKLPALKNPTTAEGRLCFLKPDKFRWQLGDPFVTLAVSDGETVTLVDASSRAARRTPVNSPQAARFSLMSGEAFGSLDKFNKAFEVVESRVASGIHQYTLKARDKRIRSQIPWIFLDIDPSKNELRALEMELKDKSRVKSVFHNPRFNVELDPSLFQPDLTGYSVK